MEVPSVLPSFESIQAATEDDDLEGGFAFEEDDCVFQALTLLNFSDVMHSLPEPAENGHGGQNAYKNEGNCVADILTQLQSNLGVPDTKKIEQLSKDLETERVARIDSDIKITKLVEFITYVHGEFGKLTKSIISMTTRNMESSNILNLGPFQDEAETVEFVEMLRSLSKQFLDEFENLTKTSNLLEKINRILKVTIADGAMLSNCDVHEEDPENVSNINEKNNDNNMHATSRLSPVSTVVLDPETFDMIETTTPSPSLKIQKRKRKILKTECHLMNLESARKKHGIDHSKRHRGYFCICGAKSSSQGNLNNHIKYFTSEWKFKCDSCNKCFLFASSLRAHLARVHKLVDLASCKFSCSTCGKEFETRSQLYTHLRVTHNLINNGARSNCDATTTTRICPTRESIGRGAVRRRFGRQSKSQNSPSVVGSELHGVDKRSSLIQCLCGSVYQYPSSLHCHIKTQLYGKVFKCSYCPRRFEIHSLLKKHVRLLHNAEYHQGRFGCGVCGKTFQNMAQVVLHRRIEHGIIRKRRRSYRTRKAVTSTNLCPKSDDVRSCGFSRPDPNLSMQGNDLNIPQQSLMNSEKPRSSSDPRDDYEAFVRTYITASATLPSQTICLPPAHDDERQSSGDSSTEVEIVHLD